MKKIVIVLVLSLTVLLSSGCNQNSVYSDDTQITKSTDKYMAVKSTATTNGNEFTMSATMTGVRTIWRYKAESDSEIEFYYNLSVQEGGKAKLVLVTPEDEATTLVENTDNTTDSEMKLQTISLKKGQNTIKIVGYDDPKFDLRVNIKEGQLGLQ